MKKTIITTVLVIGLAAGGFAYAEDHATEHNMMSGDHDMMMSGSGNNGCPGAAWSGKSGWNSEKRQKFLDETVVLRKEINDKRFEYQETLRNPEATPEQRSQLEKEIADLDTNLHNKAEQYL